MDKNFTVPLLIDFRVTSNSIEEAKRICIASIKKISSDSEIEMMGKPGIDLTFKINVKIKGVASKEDARKVAVAKMGKRLPGSRIVVLDE